MFSKLLPWLLGLMLMYTGTSCRKDLPRAKEHVDVAESPRLTSDDVGEVTLSLSGTTEEADDELRGAVHMDVSGGAAQKLTARIPTATVQALCVIRSDKKNALGQWEDAVTITPITFNVSGAGRKLRYEGAIQLKDYQKFVRGDGNRKWYFRAIICEPSRWQQVAGEYTGRIDYDVNRDGGQAWLGSQNSLSSATMHKVLSELDVPFATDWHELEVRTTSTAPTNGFIGLTSVLTFRPVGVLLRFAPQTSLPSNTGGGGHGIKYLKLTSQSFSPVGHFSLAETLPTDAAIRFTHATPTVWSETFRTHRSVEGGYGVPTNEGWFLPLWVMPRAEQKMGIEGLTIEAFLPTATGDQSFATTYNSRYVDYNLRGNYSASWGVPNLGYRDSQIRGQKRAIQSGYTYPVRFKIVRPKMPIEFVSRTLLGRYRDSGVEKSNHSSFLNDARFQGLYRATELHNPYWIPAGTHTPTVKEWKGVFGALEHNVYNYSESMDHQLEDVAFNGMNVLDYADYRSARVNGKYVRYGLRYKTSHHGKYRSAWRIEVSNNEGVSHLPFVLVKVQCVYLGPFWDVNIGTIADESWWRGEGAHLGMRFPWISEIYLATNGYYDQGDVSSLDAITAPRSHPLVMVYWLDNGNPYSIPGTGYHLRMQDSGVMGYYPEVLPGYRLFPVRPFWNAETEQ